MKSLSLKLPAILASAVSAAILAGCGTVAKFSYPDKMSALAVASQSAPYPQKVAVPPFEDFRSDDNMTSTMSLYYLPLCPFGFIECERPETGSRFPTIDSLDFTPSEDLAKAAALSLKRSNLFSDVFFTFGGEKGNADLILEGKVLSTYYKGRLLSYGLSIYSCYLWAFGAPSGTSLNKISVQLTLKTKSGRVVWDRTVSREDYIVQWIYARRGQDAKLYAPMMREAMNEAISDLASKLRASPDLLAPQAPAARQ